MSSKPDSSEDLASSGTNIRDSTSEEWQNDVNSPSLSKDSSTEAYTDLAGSDPLQILPFVTAGEGPVYVMVTSAQEMISPHSQLKKRASPTSDSGGNSGRCSRDEKRRATHNEVERRRRDKINNWITKLAKIVPDCAQDRTKQGQSKGGILAKACEYINQLVRENDRLSEIMKENELLAKECEKLRLQLLEVKNDNKRLKDIVMRSIIASSEGSQSTNS
ncbi:upstream stimulatory factor 1-like isoform X2 [Brevipalpus obovatus]|uniref:upstream stimulatory factor 1-like isoform X2 n=1 Tax=Brevipalpus obovatus TaxID=246614 RepID=UPI003D9E92F1